MLGNSNAPKESVSNGIYGCKYILHLDMRMFEEGLLTAEISTFFPFLENHKGFCSQIIFAWLLIESTRRKCCSRNALSRLALLPNAGIRSDSTWRLLPREIVNNPQGIFPQEGLPHLIVI